LTNGIEIIKKTILMCRGEVILPSAETVCEITVDVMDLFKYNGYPISSIIGREAGSVLRGVRRKSWRIINAQRNHLN